VLAVRQLPADRRHDRHLQGAKLLGEWTRRSPACVDPDQTNIAEGDRLALAAELAIPDEPAEARAPDTVSGDVKRAEA
jgi:hypothetical protein